ncbi:RDD family protein [Polluticaenibacter yanchengensis]|uniref:RDD family protein n=1 Tax=Polluticaenibacter yanchengensis TaxID=3014562 RepID=A0ABT4UGR2_9BACT|nr:RDD family protein [Chitinophagaceae bacterium LY-5]
MDQTNTFESSIFDERILERATTGQRFVNYLIDIIVFYALLFGLGVIIGITAPQTIYDIEIWSQQNVFLDRILSLLLFGIYMGITEMLLKGRTVGKFVTGTKSVTEEGDPIDKGTLFKRGMIKAVPFCAFSALGAPCYPWQDKWTNTMVIDIKKSTL